MLLEAIVIYHRVNVMLTYSDLLTYETFEDRLSFLSTPDIPAELTFGVLRHMNQKFYSSRQWKMVRDYVIARDMGFDLGIPGMEIFGRVLVHHMNPLTPSDIHTPRALDPEFLITVSDETHRAIHFGSTPRHVIVTERKPGDTKLW